MDELEKLQAKVDELTKQLEAEAGKKERILDEKKSEQAGRRELETKLAAYEEAEKKAKEQAAIEKGEFDKVLAERTREVTDLKEQLLKGAKDRALTDGLNSIEIAPNMRAGVEALHAGKVEIVDGKATIEGKSPAEYFAAWAQTDEGKAYVVAKSSGSDLKGVTPGAKVDLSSVKDAAFSGSKAQRQAAIAAKFPELAK